MENAEEVQVLLEEWGRRGKAGAGAGRAVPRALDEYLAHVARTGDPVFSWGALRPLLKDKLAACAGEFRESSPGLDVPPAPNLDPFDYEAARAALAERLDAFCAAPFTVQRLCELLVAPRAHYARIDKFMRALEKNVLVVSTREPGPTRRAPDPDPEPQPQPRLNGAGDAHDAPDTHDVDMEDSGWRDADPLAGTEPERCDADDAMTPPGAASPRAGLSPPDADRMDSEPTSSECPSDENISDEPINSKPNSIDITEATQEKIQVEAKPDPPPENVEMDLSKESTSSTTVSTEEIEVVKDLGPVDPKCSADNNEPEQMVQESSELKAESITSGEDSSSSNSSENTDGDSERGGGGGGDTTPKSPERSGASEGESSSCDVPENDDDGKPPYANEQQLPVQPDIKIQSDNYTIADVHSNLPQTELTVAETPVVQTETTDKELSKEPEPAALETAVESTTVEPVDKPVQVETTEKPEESQST